MKKVEIPSIAYVNPYHMYADKIPKNRVVKLGDSRHKIHKLFMAADPNFSAWSGMLGNQMEFFHFSRVDCKKMDVTGMETFHTTPVVCIACKDGKVVGIREHFPYKGKHNPYEGEANVV